MAYWNDGFLPNVPVLQHSHSLSSLFRIKHIAQAISKCVETKNCQKYRRGGEGDHMRIAAHSAVAVLGQGAPARTPITVGIIDADADETQRRFGEDC